jgi:hypothetical protein
MSLKLGGSTSKSSSTSNTQAQSQSQTQSQSHSTTTPTVPAWASSLTQNVAGRVGGLLNADPYSSVAPPSALQVQATNGASGLNTSRAAPQIGATSVGQGASVLDGLQNYMSPYTNDVVNTALADYDYGAGQTRAQQALDLAGSGAFGGSGAALTQSMTEDALTRRGTTSANLRDQAFNAGASLANQDADRRQQATIQNAQLARDQASQNANLTFANDANSRANIGAQADLGGTMRDISQQYAQAPTTSAQQLVAMLSGLPINLFTGQETNTSGTDATSGSSSGTTTASGKSSEVHADASFP